MGNMSRNTYEFDALGLCAMGAYVVLQARV